MGRGLAPARVAIIGEAPGTADESRKKVWAGSSGRELRKAAKIADLALDGAFLCHAVACRPPVGKKPSKKEYTACGLWLRKQLRRVRPRYVLLTGLTPLKAVLGLDTLGKHRGKAIERDGVIYVPTWHPSAVFHDPTKAKDIEADLALFAEIVRTGKVPELRHIILREVHDAATFREMLTDLYGHVSFDLETSCLYPWGDEALKKNPYYDDPVVTSFGIGTARQQWVIPFNHYEVHPFSHLQQRKMVERAARKLQSCIVSGHNGKFDSLWTRVHYGIFIDQDHDTQLGNHALNEVPPHDLKQLVERHFGERAYDIEPWLASWGELAPYHAQDLYWTRRLRIRQKKMLADEPAAELIYRKLSMPLSHDFARSEYNGIYINPTGFEEAETYLESEIVDAEARLSKYKKDVNWASSQQVGVFLFDDLGLDVTERTPTGNPATGEAVLKRIDHPAVREILRHRRAVKMRGTFIKGWKGYIVKNMLHPSFKIHGTTTGRPACEHPNWQQTDRDPRIRSLADAPRGWVFCETDNSQIELRVAAEISGDATMLELFDQGGDMHWLTAITEISRGGGDVKLMKSTGRELIGLKRPTYGQCVTAVLDAGPKRCTAFDKQWKDRRFKAKAVNFGYLYGMGAKGFREYAFNDYDIVLTEEEAEQSRDSFFALYSGLPTWHERQTDFIKWNGYAVTLTGRKRHLPEVWSKDRAQVAYAIRQGINSPVQGTASDLLLMAFIEFGHVFPPHIVRLIATVHDSIQSWIRPKHVRSVVPQMIQIMQAPKLMADFGLKLNVPLIAEAELGPWSRGVELSQYLKQAA